MSMTLDEVQRAIQSVPSGFDYHFDADPVQVVVLPDSVRMDVVPRSDDRTLRDSVDAWIQALAPTGIDVLAVVNGSYGARSSAFSIAPVADYGLGGRVVRNGQIAQHGTSDRVDGFLAFTEGGYVLSFGNTPENFNGKRVVAGLGGLLRLIEKYCPVATGFYANLRGESNEGRVIVGHDPRRRRIIVIVQDESIIHYSNYSLNRLRDFALSIGCRDAVGLDGSTSAMLRCGLGCHRDWVIRNAEYKNRICANAVAFFRPRSR